MVVKALTGKEPDAMMADYRNRSNRKMQGVKEAIDIELRTTLLNPNFIRERMKGDEGTAMMFGETFRNIFGWSVTRPSALDANLYDDLYRIYVADELQLGIQKFFQQKNPAAYQSMTAVMMEGARKGYWKPDEKQLNKISQLHADYTRRLSLVENGQNGGEATVLEKQGGNVSEAPSSVSSWWMMVVVLVLLLSVIIWLRLKNGNHR